jgi:hypothetical protein
MDGNMQVEATTPACILSRSMVLTGHARSFSPRRPDNQPVLGFCGFVLWLCRSRRRQNGSHGRYDDHDGKRRFGGCG